MKTTNLLGPSILSFLAALAAFGTASTARASCFLNDGGCSDLLCGSTGYSWNCADLCDDDVPTNPCTAGCYSSLYWSWTDMASAYSCVTSTPIATNVRAGYEPSNHLLVLTADVSNGYSDATDASNYIFYAMKAAVNGVEVIQDANYTNGVTITNYLDEGYDYYRACVQPIVYGGGGLATGTTVCSDWLRISSTQASEVTSTSKSLSMDGTCYPLGTILMIDENEVFWFQEDGNLVLYKFQNDPSNVLKVAWAAGSNLHNASEVCLQGDGNMVVYTSSGGVVWASGSNLKGVTTLDLQSDCNLVLYTPSGSPKWATGTNPC